MKSYEKRRQEAIKNLERLKKAYNESKKYTEALEIAIFALEYDDPCGPCEGCKYEETEAFEKPCCICARNIEDYYNPCMEKK